MGTLRTPTTANSFPSWRGSGLQVSPGNALLCPQGPLLPLQRSAEPVLWAQGFHPQLQHPFHLWYHLCFLWRSIYNAQLPGRPSHAARKPLTLLQVPGLPHHAPVLRERHLDRFPLPHCAVTHPGQRSSRQLLLPPSISLCVLQGLGSSSGALRAPSGSGRGAGRGDATGRGQMTS